MTKNLFLLAKDLLRYKCNVLLRRSFECTHFELKIRWFLFPLTTGQLIEHTKSIPQIDFVASFEQMIYLSIDFKRRTIEKTSPIINS